MLIYFSTTGVDTPAAAYHVIPERKVDRVAGAMMASTHVYDLSVSIFSFCTIN